MDPDAWIKQVDAAKIRKVSRQAISKLVAAGRIRTFSFGGYVFVSKKDVLEFKPLPKGRKAVR